MDRVMPDDLRAFLEKPDHLMAREYYDTLIAENDELRTRVTYDTRTGLFREDVFNADLEREVERAKRSGFHPWILVGDLDDLKGLNTKHTTGPVDDAFKKLGGTLRGASRGSERAYRMHDAGDEFAILGNYDEDGTLVQSRIVIPQYTAARRFYDVVRTVKVESISGVSSLSMSIGGSVYPFDGGNARALLDRANQRLQIAKTDHGIYLG